MVYQGHIENGVVVFHEPVPLANGTAVRVEAVVPQAADFWDSCSLDELARRQGVSMPGSIDEMLGGWPNDEIDGVQLHFKLRLFTLLPPSRRVGP